MSNKEHRDMLVVGRKYYTYMYVARIAFTGTQQVAHYRGVQEAR